MIALSTRKKQVIPRVISLIQYFPKGIVSCGFFDTTCVPRQCGDTVNMVMMIGVIRPIAWGLAVVAVATDNFINHHASKVVVFEFACLAVGGF